MSSPAVAPSVAAAATTAAASAPPAASAPAEVAPVSYYYQSSSSPAVPLWAAPHPTETLISLICRPISGSGHGVTARFERIIGERLLHFGLLHNESGIVFDFNDPVGNANPEAAPASAGNTIVNTDGSRTEVKVPVAMPVILSVTPTAPGGPSTQAIHDVEGRRSIPDHHHDTHNATVIAHTTMTPMPVASPVAAPPPLVTVVSPHGHHHAVHHGQHAGHHHAHPPQSNHGAMMKVIARAPAALYSDLRAFVRQKGDARFRSHSLEDFAHGQPVWYIHHGLTLEQQAGALKRAIAVDEAGGLVPNSDGRPRVYDAVRWNCQHVLFWIMSGSELPPDAHPGLDSGQIGLVADKARAAAKEGHAAAIAVADSVQKGYTATVAAAKGVAEKYPVQTAVVTAAATSALIGLGVWYKSASSSIRRPRSASASPPLPEVNMPAAAAPVQPASSGSGTRSRGNSAAASPAAPSAPAKR